MSCVIVFPTTSKRFTFVGSQVVIDEKYFKDKVSPQIFTGLDACIMIGSEEMHVKVHPTSNQTGETFYVLSESLASDGSSSYSYLR